MPACAGTLQSPRRAARWEWPALVALLGLMLGLLMHVAPALAAPAVPPAPDDWVTDRVGVMSSTARASLNRRLAAYEQQSGHQIIVWIDRGSGEIPIESFAVEAFEQWKLGRQKLDDGLGIFIMAEDRAIRVEVGYGLEPVVTDLVASQVIRSTMIPAIQRGEWDAAVIGGVEQLVDTIEAQAGSLPADPQAGVEQAPVPSEEERWVRIAKTVGIVIGVIVLLILFITNPRLAFLLLFFLGRGGGGGGGGGGFGGGGGRSGGGGATGRW